MSADTDVMTVTVTKQKLKKPSKWNVIMHNDDKTPIDFVAALLSQIFGYERERAKEITLEIHETGSAIVGCYSFEIAETKVHECTKVSAEMNFPLKTTMEEV